MRFVSGYIPAVGYETTHEVCGRKVRSTRSGRQLKVSRDGRVLMYGDDEHRSWRHVDDLVPDPAPGPGKTVRESGGVGGWKGVWALAFLLFYVTYLVVLITVTGPATHSVPKGPFGAFGAKGRAVPEASVVNRVVDAAWAWLEGDKNPFAM